MVICVLVFICFFFFSSRRRHTRLQGDWSSDVCSSDLVQFTLDGLHAFLGLVQRIRCSAACRVDGFLGGIRDILGNVLGGIGGFVHGFLGLAHWFYLLKTGMNAKGGRAAGLAARGKRAWAGRGVKAAPPPLLDQPNQKGDDSHDHENIEQDLGDAYSTCRNTTKTEYGSYQGDDEEHDGVVQHVKLLGLFVSKKRHGADGPSAVCMGSTVLSRQRCI